MTDFPARDSGPTGEGNDDFAAWALDLLLEYDSALALCGLVLDGRIRIWHTSAERLLGHWAADVIGRRLDQLAPAEHRRQGLVTRALFSASATGRAELDLALVARTGQRQTCRLDIRPQPDTAPGFVVLIREIGPAFDRPRQRRSRRDPRAAHRANLALIGGEPGWIGLGLETEIAQISSLGAEYLNIVAEDWIGRPLADLLAPDDATNWYVLLHRAVGTAVPQRVMVVSANAQPGDPCWPMTVLALHDDDGVLIGFTLALGEPAQATERRTAPPAGDEQSAERAWFNAVVHDMREPLRRIREYAHAWRDDEAADPGPRAAGYLERIDAAVTRLQDNINGILRLARIDIAPFAVQPVDLKALVETVLDDLEMLVHDHGAQVTVDELGFVSGDPVQLRLLFQNLIDNSIRYRRPDVAPCIRIARCDDEQASGVQLRYVDNARGFAEPEAALASAHRDAIAGTGIGLDLCRRIARRHRGDLAITETHGQGTTFLLTLAWQDRPGATDAEGPP